MRNNFIDPSGKTSATMNKFTDPPEFMDPPGAMSDVRMMGNSYGMTNGASGNAVGGGGTTGMHQIPTHTFDGGTGAHPWRSNASPYNPSRVPSRPSPSPSSTPSLSRPSFPGRTNDDECQQSNKILNELRIKNELIQQDIDRMKKGETGGTGVGPNMPVQLGVQSRQPSTDPLLSPDWNELRMKNELIKQDIDRMNKGATGGNSGRFLPTGGGGNAAIGTRVGPTLPFQSVVQSRQPSTTTPTLSPRQRMVQSLQRGGNLPKQEKAQGGEEEVLMSHSDTLKHLFHIR
jgi:hypothetical protein